jgi:uncharacterized protein (TIGR03546 family)
MTLLLKQLFNFFKLLNSDKGTNQIAAGIAVGFILGMTPFFSLQSILIFVLMFIFRIQIGAATLSAFFFAFAAWALDDVFHFVGHRILELEGLKGIFTTLYNMPIVPYTRFNNSVVMGSGVVAITLSPLVFILGKKLVIKYRESVVERFKQTKIWHAFKATSFYKWYSTYENLYGA